MLSGTRDFDLRGLITKIDNSTLGVSLGKGFTQQDIYSIQHSQLISLKFNLNIHGASLVFSCILKRVLK